MALIEWRKQFETGIPDVDYEHAQLVELINTLGDKLQEHPTRELIAGMLGEIYAQISAHFAGEETIMRERGYDQYADHKADHEQLLDEIRDIMEAFQTNPDFAYEGVLAERLTSWFTGHFQTKDARFHRMMG